MTSIFNGYPIGALLLMENSGAYDWREIEGVPIHGEVHETETDLVLDGQQRLTSCYRAFYGTLDTSAKYPGRYFFDYRAFVDALQGNDEVDGSLVEDFFVFERPAKVRRTLDATHKEMAAGLFPLDIIFRSPRGSNYSKWLNDYSFAESRGDRDAFERLSAIGSTFQTRFIEKITGYQVNYEKITRDTSPDVICTIFETINTTGIKLTVFVLLVAKCFKANIRLRDKLEETLEQFQWIQRLDPEGDLVATIQLPRIISSLHNGQCRKGDILRLKPDAIATRWDQAVAALNRALKVVHDHLGGISVEYIPSMDAIAPLAVLCADYRFSLEAHFAKLARWYWCVAFSQYLSGAPESKIARVLREWQREGGWLANDEAEPESVKNFVFRKSQLDDATKQSAIYKGLLALIMSRDPQDIGKERVKLRELPASEVQDHHIFPQRYLHSHGIKGAKANGILNRMPMWGATNLRIGAAAPNNYLNDESIVGEPVSQVTLDTYGMTRESTDINFTAENYELFLISRKDNLTRIVAEAVGRAITELAPADD